MTPVRTPARKIILAGLHPGGQPGPDKGTKARHQKSDNLKSTKQPYYHAQFYLSLYFCRKFLQWN